MVARVVTQSLAMGYDLRWDGGVNRCDEQRRANLEIPVDAIGAVVYH